jgi:hypothetical protein
MAVLDVGGQVGLQWFSHLRSAARDPAPPPPAAAMLRMVGSWFVRLERRFSGRVPTEIRFMRQDGRVVRGQWASGTPDLHAFALGYASPMDKPVAPFVLGIGPLSFFGARDFAAVLQIVSESGITPRALIRDHDTHATLWRWARAEFPRARPFALRSTRPRRVLRHVLESEA